MLLVTLLACGASGPCDSKFSDDAVAVTGMPERYRSEASSQLLAQDCELSPALEATLDELASMPPDYRGLMDLKLAAEDPEAWSAACFGGTPALALYGQTGDRVQLWETCALERYGWFTLPEFTQMKLIVAPIMATHELQSQGAPEMESRWAVRMLAGLPPR